jgi:membrane-associated phospholipid phosphatase
VLAAAVAYSRVYLGVHYPGDVLLGGVWGGLIGAVLSTGYLGVSSRVTFLGPLSETPKEKNHKNHMNQ